MALDSDERRKSAARRSPRARVAAVVQSGGVDQLKSQLTKVESDAKALESSAKSDFPRCVSLRRRFL